MSPRMGQTMPDIEVHIKDENGIDTINIAEFCADKTVALFTVPGAFTPTCSMKHAPSYLEHYEGLTAKGIDAILCLSVNDAHVMQAWGKDLQSEGKIMMVADAQAALSEALGLAVHMGPVLGTRASRASMVIDKGVISHLFVEEPMEYKVSSAEHMLSML